MLLAGIMIMIYLKSYNFYNKWNIEIYIKKKELLEEEILE